MRVFGFCVLVCGALVFSTLGVSTSAWAQPGISQSSSGITATAVESVPVKAQRLRLVMLLKAKGADPKSAIVALTEHKQRVQKELEAMKADKESIAFSASRLSGGTSAEAQRMQAMQMQMQMQMGNPAAAASKGTIPTVHTAICALKAEWPLPAGEGDALALLPATLNEQVKARDLAGDNNKPKLSKEAQEQLEELEGMVEQRFSYSSSDNDPTSKIYFVASVPADAKQKATAAAFAKATKEVDALAQSTGQKRGKLLSLSTDSANSYAAMMRNAYGGYMGGQDASGTALLSKFESDESLVFSANPDELSVVVTIAVQYALE